MSQSRRLKRKSFDIFDKTKSKVYIEGHRGVNREMPENTLDSFTQAINYNLDSIELDVWLSKEGVPVVIHGGNKGEIDEFVDKEGTISNFTIQEIKQFRTKNGNKSLPSLEEVLDLCKEKIFINIELKDHDIQKTFEAVISLLENKDMIGQVSLSSFKHDYYNFVKAYNDSHEKKIEFGFLYDDEDDKNFIPYKFGYEKCSMNVYHKNLTEELAKKAHESGMAIFVWYGMKDEESEEEYARLIKCGVDVICCNLPNKLQKYFANIL